MIGIEVKAPEAPADLIEKLAKSAPKAVALAIQHCAAHTEGVVKDTITEELGGFGTLSASFNVVMLSSGDKISAGVMSPLPYAEIQDEGGPVRSSRPGKNGRPANLAFPPDRHMFKAGVRARDMFDSMRFIPAPDKPDITGYFVDKFSKSGPILWILMPEVEIPGTGYLETSLRKSQPEYPRIMQQTLEKLVKQAEASLGGE